MPRGTATGRLLLGLLLLAALCVGATPALAAPTATPEAWQADLDYLLAELPARHAKLFTQTAEADWRAAAADLRGAIPTLSDGAIVTRLLSLVALAGDSHTVLDIAPLKLPVYPFDIYWFDDGLTVLAADHAYAGCLRSQLTAINGHPVQEVVDRLGTVFAHENQSQYRKTLPYYAMTGELLYGLGLTDDPAHAQFSFLDQQGQSATWDVYTMPAADIAWTGAVGRGDPCPLYRQQPQNPYFYMWVPELALLYLQYNACRERDDLPLAEFTQMTLDALAQYPYTRFVLDLRNNGGGNSALLDPLIEALAADPGVNQRGKLFVIIGRRTFSSALLNAISLKQKTQAILVGEPTGGKPNHFGEVREFVLPNSGLSVFYSTKYFTHSTLDTPSLEPDIVTGMTSAEYFAGADPALNAVLNYR